MSIDPRSHIVYCAVVDDLLTELTWRKPTEQEAKDFYIDKDGHLVKLAPAPFIETTILVSDFKTDGRTRAQIVAEQEAKRIKAAEARLKKKEKDGIKPILQNMQSIQPRAKAPKI